MGWVYVLRSGRENLFKVGRTAGSVEDRIKQLATGNPYRLTRFDAIETNDAEKGETYLQGILHSKRCSDGDSKEFFAAEPGEMSQAVAATRRFLKEELPHQKEAAMLAVLECDDRLLDPTGDDWEMWREIHDLREQETFLRIRREVLETRLKLRIGTSSGIDGIATWKSHDRRTLDTLALRRSEPKIFERFLKVTHTRRFLLNNPPHIPVAEEGHTFLHS